LILKAQKPTYASEEIGIDGGKKIKGRKRHIVVDIMGNLLAICVHAANIHDTKSGIIPAKKLLKNIAVLKSFAETTAIESPLNYLFLSNLVLLLIFLNALNLNLKFCQKGGL
jgi:hypothetical protein